MNLYAYLLTAAALLMIAVAACEQITRRIDVKAAFEAKNIRYDPSKPRGRRWR